ncbi:TlpA family protein disulfide reductase [Roseimarinus sediminis]|uniref:TlpA family protein disulfide reductase n=1 Tax=Roseimarinus sediminis TaxID=1610899 RepID=UPI003D1C47D8
MKHLLKIFILLCISLFIMNNAEAQTFQKEIPADYGYIVTLGQTVPDFDLLLPNETQTSMKALRGKVVMLQFTASWCGVCRKEMPHIEKDIWQKHKNNPDFALYGIDLKEPAEKVLEFQQQMQITYPLALDLDGSIFYAFAEQNAGVTRNVIIDKDGKIVFMTRLFKEEEFEEMKRVIEKLLK